jgi:hypothetical protein
MGANIRRHHARMLLTPLPRTYLNAHLLATEKGAKYKTCPLDIPISIPSLHLIHLPYTARGTDSKNYSFFVADQNCVTSHGLVNVAEFCENMNGTHHKCTSATSPAVQHRGFQCSSLTNGPPQIRADSPAEALPPPRAGGQCECPISALCTHQLEFIDQHVARGVQKPVHRKGRRDTHVQG